MRKLFVVSVAAVSLVNAAALASDLPTKAPIKNTPVATPSYNWSGFYVGANFGGAWTNGSLNIPGNSFYRRHQRSSSAVSRLDTIFRPVTYYFGVEGDIDGASFNHPALPVPTLGSVSNHWISTVAGRVGLVNDRWLVFAKLGGGWVQSSATVNLPGSPNWNGSSTNGAWLIGGGVEYGFKPHWTVKLEYDYLALSNWTSATVPAVSLNHDLQMVKAGINYKFESGVSAAAEPSGAGGAAEPGKPGKASQNPIADLVSVPFQSNTNFRSGPFNRTQEILNIQPVVPMHLNENWNMISRTIIPLMS